MSASRPVVKAARGVFVAAAFREHRLELQRKTHDDTGRAVYGA
jgi:hypothetical protein